MSRTNDRVYQYRRAKLKATPGLTCVLCGEPIDVTLPQYDPMAFWADHVESVATGGDNRGTLQPMHRLCNQRKGIKAWDAVRSDQFSRKHY